jgi:hypothetical protein
VATAFQSLHAGDVVAGFRLERLLGRGETGAVYEATQLSLGRAVALRLIDPARYPNRDMQARLDRELQLASSLHRPGLVPVFEAGEWRGGRFVAMRLIRGQCLGSRPRTAGRTGGAPVMLQPVAAGLEAAHQAGLSHGAVRPENVLVDDNGRAHLADLGLGRGSGRDADREGLTELRRAVGASAASGFQWRVLALAAAVVAGVAAIVIAPRLETAAGERGHAEEPAPAVTRESVPLGSDLAAGPMEEVGCGSQLGGASACTLVPADIRGVALRARESGVIRTWAVRGATGELTLEVLRSQAGATRLAGFSQPAEAPDAGPHRFSAAIGVARGDLIAVRLGPGAALGQRQNGGAALRWAGAVSPLPPLAQATSLNGELLVRADVEPGARPPLPAQILGRRARAAPPGPTLGEATVAVSARSAVQVRLVRAADQINLDAFRGSRRKARLTLGDADPDGELIHFEQNCGNPQSVCVRWRNPGEATPLLHQFTIAPNGAFRVIG